jgi:hypothetical protein
MASERRSRLISVLLALALLGVAQWFFGNLYEAVVTAPNWRVGFEYEAITGRSQNADRPIRYYVPTTWVAVVLLWAATILGWRAMPDAKRWLAVGSASSVAAVALSVYIITQLNLRLFYIGPVREIESVRPLMERWQILNWVRVSIVGTVLGATAAALHFAHRAWVLRRFETSTADCGPPNQASQHTGHANNGLS